MRTWFVLSGRPLQPLPPPGPLHSLMFHLAATTMALYPADIDGLVIIQLLIYKTTKLPSIDMLYAYIGFPKSSKSVNHI